MSKKDFDIYYNQLCDQYVQLNEELKAFQEAAADHPVDPAKFEILKKSFQPILDSYQMISWVAFLLNKPAKKDKTKKYEKMLNKKMSKMDPKFGKEKMVAQNNSILENVKESTKQLQKDGSRDYN